MFQRVGKHLTPATAIAFLALLLAITGGAFAATGHGGTSGGRGSARATTAKSSKGKTGPRGPKGPAGPKGATGATGATGPAGAAGAAGAKGENGAAGAPGATGLSGEGVTIAPAGSACAEGGTKFTVAGKTEHVCNGEEGAEGQAGKEGSPWTDGGTLPAGATETGTWYLEVPDAEVREKGEPVDTAFSFPIPLAAPIENVKGPPAVQHIFILEPGEEETADCPGTATEPKALAGDLCVYIGNASEELTAPGVHPPVGGAIKTGTGGALLRFNTNNNLGERATAQGSWAVTAPAAT